MAGTDEIDPIPVAIAKRVKELQTGHSEEENNIGALIDETIDDNGLLEDRAVEVIEYLSEEYKLSNEWDRETIEKYKDKGYSKGVATLCAIAEASLREYLSHRLE